jgi:hypothetical protein
MNTHPIELSPLFLDAMCASVHKEQDIFGRIRARSQR